MALAWNSSKKHSDVERWICIYPVYINSKKTLAAGRKLAKDKCVENPTYEDIRNALLLGGFKVYVEDKLHPRERSKELMYRGRIRVELKNDDGTPVQPDYPTRDSILMYLGNTIPKLGNSGQKVDSRHGKQGSSDHHQHSQSSGSSTKKGKGKGRR